MNRKTVLGMTLLSISCAVAYATASRGAGGGPQPAQSSTVAVGTVAAPGRVEPISEEIDVGSELTGQLAQVLVTEGDHVQPGQVLAIIANREYQSQVASARATLDDRLAALRRLLNGARVQERREARAAVDEAAAVMAQALAARDRRRVLFAEGTISREEVDRAEESWAVAVAQHRAAAERYAVVDAPPREEDRARAEAAVAVARAETQEAEALLAKSCIRSPIDGVVLRRHHRAGETVLSLAADPIVTVGDISRLRVRAEIDELDVAAVRPGLSATIRADAYPSQPFAAVVTQVGKALGKKRIRTELPAERMDTNVLEVLLDLEDTTPLRPGLRVDVFIEGARSTKRTDALGAAEIEANPAGGRSDAGGR